MNTEAIYRYATAKGYIETAKLAVMNPLWEEPSRAVASILPLSMLGGFALELFFKAWLLECGHTSAIVKKFGHDVDRLFSEVQKFGFCTDEDIDIVVDAFASKHKDFTFRYIGESDTVKNIEWDHAFPVFDRIDLAVDIKIGASVSMGLKPGH